MTQWLHDIFILPWRDATSIFWPIVVQGMLVACALGLLGCYLVVRGLSLLGDALSHAVLPGIAIGFFVSQWMGGGSLSSPWIMIGATAMGVAAAVMVHAVHSQSRVKEDASLGIVFTTLFSLGVVLISRYASGVDLDAGCVLYGNIEYFVNLGGDTHRKLYPMAVILGLIVAGIVVFYRPLLISTFDPALAVSVGVSASIVHYALMTTLSLTIVASFESVGAILAVAFLIVPGATARLWTNRMSVMLLAAAGFGILSALLGYWISHENLLNTSAGAAMAAAGFGLFVVSWLLAPRSGLISQWVVRRRLRRQIELENLVKTIAELPAPARGVRATLVNELKWSEQMLTRVAARGAARGWLVKSAAPGDPLVLTPAGEGRAARLAAAHQAWEAYLQAQLNLPKDHVHDAAEWIEHYLDDGELTAIRPAGSDG